MNEQEKSLKLAELMGWEISPELEENWMYVGEGDDIGTQLICPYEDGTIGRSQFAAILLKFPEVMERFVRTDDHTDACLMTIERYEEYGGDYQGYLTNERKPTQSNILDEILRMNRVKID